MFLSLQDKGKQPLHDEDSEDEDEEEQEVGEQQEQGGCEAGAADGTGSGADGSPAGGAALPNSPRGSDEPGDMTCAICLGGIPLENLALVKVGRGRVEKLLAAQSPRGCGR